MTRQQAITTVAITAAVVLAILSFANGIFLVILVIYLLSLIIAGKTWLDCRREEVRRRAALVQRFEDEAAAAAEFHRRRQH